MKSEAVKKWMDASDKKRAQILELDETAAKLEAAGMKASIVDRVFEEPIVWISRDLREVEDMAAVAADYLKRLAVFGFHLAAKSGECPYSDYPEINRREWRLTGNVTLALFTPYGEGAKCKFIQRGVEEKPVYELVCE